MTAVSTGVDRREALALTLSAAALATAPGTASAAAKAVAATPAKRFSGMLAQFAEELLRLSPETATSLGLDSGRRLALKSQWSDGSKIGDARWAAQVKSMLTRLGSVNRATLSAADQIRYDTVRHAATMGVEGTKWTFGGAGSGWNGGTAPYPVTQQDGALTAVPEFLDSQHQIKNRADAEAYVARVAGFAKLLDQFHHMALPAIVLAGLSAGLGSEDSPLGRFVLWGKWRAASRGRGCFHVRTDCSEAVQ